MRPKHTVETLRLCFHNRMPVLLTSAPGCGKSDVVELATKLEGMDFIPSHPVVDQPIDYKGFPVCYKDDDGVYHATFVAFSNLNRILDGVCTKPTVFFLDDLGQAAAQVQAAAMQLLLARRIGEHKVSDFVTFVAATNRRQDKAGVQGILEPVKSRFATILELTVHTEDWVSWAIEHDMPAELIAFVRFSERKGKSMLFDFVPSMDMTNTPNPRTVANAGKLFNLGINDHLQMEIFEGACGKAWAVEFVAFLKIFKALPSLEEILLRPEQVQLPDMNRVDILCAVAGALANKADLNNWLNIVKYANRLPDEYSTFLVHDATTRDPMLMDSTAYVDWANKHQQMLT